MKAFLPKIALFLSLFCLSFYLITPLQAQTHSAAREWNEALLFAIRKDFARPTVHARNLWHTSIAMYDAWAAYEPLADNYFLGDTLGNFICTFTGVPTPVDKKAAQEEAISFAAYRLLRHRFAMSPGAAISIPHFDSVFIVMGYDSSITASSYTSGVPAHLGNYIAQQLISYGLQDGSNEQNGYVNTYYNPVNPTLLPAYEGNPNMVDPNRWQPLTLSVFIDQAGIVYPINTPPFLSPEWGNVDPFAMTAADMSLHTRNGNTYKVFHNPPTPPQLDTLIGGVDSDLYKWNFSLVSKWSSHLDTTDGVMWDISPASIGNVQWYPSTFDSFPYFYDEYNGGDIGQGHALNPATGMPYTPQIVHRGDYARVLAEFWADGPDSETPPGHWYTLLNYVNDHPLTQKRWKGVGPVLPDLEWDVKAYFTMGGAIHDAAVTAWAAKGWFDYLRPISAIRYMADRGQSTSPLLPNYDIAGIPLDTGYIELVDSLDPLAGVNFEHVGKIKIFAWQGNDSLPVNVATEMAGVDWILAENWWPYQRPSFVTPPFAGYFSGHSTFSRAGAEVMTAITGDPFFPGGMGEFHAPQNDFLVFEEGPSTNIVLQWATYRDASDQCSLSRIWGGIHPPADDIPGRIIGEVIGIEAFEKARHYWENDVPDITNSWISQDLITDTLSGSARFSITVEYALSMNMSIAPIFNFPVENPLSLQLNSSQSSWLNDYTYQAVYDVNDVNEVLWNIDYSVSAAVGDNGYNQAPYSRADAFAIEMENPILSILQPAPDTITPQQVGPAGFQLTLTFTEPLNSSLLPQISFPVEDALAAGLSYNSSASAWLNNRTFLAIFNVNTLNNSLFDIDVMVDGVVDTVGNIQAPQSFTDVFSIQTPVAVIDAQQPKPGALLFPNPVKKGDNFALQLLHLSDMVDIQLIDLQGRILWQKQVQNTHSLIELSTESLAAGAYTLQIRSGAVLISKKLMVE